ncbi:hypothetical protein AAA081_08875 [Aedoeadaptatus acetigenes]|uniref:Uncharacterized protein n=1 Tax=Aedoeadaptatus acetigenes TaxID=2981723 RepID=A0ABV1J894_9FIRM
MTNFLDLNRRSDVDDDSSRHVPNDVTREALREAERLAADPRTRYFSDVEEALAELKKD